MEDVSALLVENLDLGQRLFKLVLKAPAIANAAEPGQFVHVKLNGFDAHILRRPISVYNANKDDGTIELIIQEVGEGTRFLHDAKLGAQFDLIGPIGHGWSKCGAGDNVLLVGGGVGAAPLFMQAQNATLAGAKVSVVLGAQTKDALVTLHDYETLLHESVYCATDDGSFGEHGFCTSIVERILCEENFDRVFVCGPHPLMKIVAGLCEKAKVPCEVSIEKRMACGVGACLSCVVDTKSGKKRACVDGPVFSSEEIVW
jgi:dihydroorotate dehydrogenase electron transfer subunit